MTKALLHRAAAFQKRGNFREAERLCNEVLVHNPGSARAWHLLGITALHRKEFAQAAGLLAQAVQSDPRDGKIFISLAALHLATRSFDNGLSAVARAISLGAASAEAYVLLAHCLIGNRSRFAEAEGAAAQALKLRPAWIEAQEAMAFARFGQGDGESALEMARYILAQDPSRAPSHRLAGDIHQSAGRWDQALHHYSAALSLDPLDATLNLNCGLLLTKVGRLEDAVRVYRTAFTHAPSDPQVRAGLGQALLTLGQFAEGWPLFAARSQTAHSERKRPVSTFVWDATVKGRKVLVWADQGLGEQIMFASLLPDLIRSGAEIKLECDARLIPLFRRSFPGLEFIASEETQTSDSGEAHISLVDTAQWIRPTFESFPRHSGYLIAEPIAVARLGEKYRATTPRATPLVGISWRTQDRGKVTAQKSLDLTRWGPILSVPGVTFVDLQYGDHGAEVAQAARQFGARIISDPSVDALTDLDGFAAQVKAMDLVITTSNTTAHIAGALDVPAMTLVPAGYGGLWHWFLDRADSPWYPSMHLLRQDTVGDWSSVIDRASEHLVNFTADFSR